MTQVTRSAGGLCFWAEKQWGEVSSQMRGQRHIHKLNMAGESHLSCSFSGILTAFMSILFNGCKQLNGSKSSCRVLVGSDHMRRFVEHTCIFIVYFGCLVTAGGREALNDLGATEVDRSPGTCQG